MTHATMRQATARVSRTIAASPGEIWKALTGRETLRQFFFGADVETDWQVGHPIRFKSAFKGKSYEDKGEIRRMGRRRHLSFSHWSALAGVPDTRSITTGELRSEPQGEATEMTLTQSNLMGGINESDIQHRAEYEENWRAVHDCLERVVVGK